MSRWQRSSVWDYFKKNSDKIVQCTLRDTKLTYHGGTSSMGSHLIAKHDQIVSLDSSDSSARTKIDGLFFVGVKRKCSSDRAAKVTKLVCEMVARLASS